MINLYEQGLCVPGDVADLFFSEDVRDLGRAQAICSDCSVQIECLQIALENGEEWGVWGGVIFWDGVPFYRRRGRGRPRKDASNDPLEVSRDELWQLVKSA